MYHDTLAVLLIDDDEDDYLIVRDLLTGTTRVRFRLDWVASYAEAELALAQDQHDVYLVDYRLGPHDGFQLIQHAIAAGCSAPLIVLTGLEDGDTDIAALQAGAVDYLVKGQLSSHLLESALRYAVERAHILAELRASNERYRLVAETATDAILTVDQAGVIAFANYAAERIFGYSREELIGCPVELLMPEYLPAARREEQQRGAAGAGPAAARGPIDQLGRHKSGQLIPLELSIGIAHEGARLSYTGIIRDVSERRRLEEELRHAQKMEAVGRLAGGVAHDFNNVLTAITGYSELLLNDMARGQGPQREDLEQILQAARRASQLTQQLLAFSRKQVLQPEVLSLNATIVEMELILRRMIGEDVMLRMQLAPRLSMVEVDPGRIQQVIMNLVVNARDAMPDGGMLTIATANQADRVALIVSDTGQGMDSQTLQRVFEPFFTTKERGKGTGLGLATVYGIITQSGGEISVRSAPGQGSSFTVLLPRATRDGKSGPAAGEPQRRSGSETILLVEDDPGVRGMIESVLRQDGYQVLSAASGPEALDCANTYPRRIHLLLTDVMMPGMNGVELVHLLEDRRPEMRVLYISGYADEAINRYGVREPDVAFLQKPFQLNDLARKVREVLDAESCRTVNQQP